MARMCSHAALRSENVAPPFEQPRDATSYYCEGQSEYLILHGPRPFVLVVVLVLPPSPTLCRGACLACEADLERLAP